MTDLLIKDLQQYRYNPADYEAVEMPTLGAKNGIKLVEMIGADYNDPKWQQLLDQLTYEEMCAMIGDSFHWRMPAASVQAPGSRDENGPQGLTVTLFGSTLGVETTAFTSEDVMAATFNRELLYKVGNIIGNDCLAADVCCLYGPGANMHRMPYGGRNFEYYSEDPLLAGRTAAAIINGAQSNGIGTSLKHFAGNSQEINRLANDARISLRALREIYLKNFEIAVREAQPWTIMTSYNYINGRYTSEDRGLLEDILRKELFLTYTPVTDECLAAVKEAIDEHGHFNTLYETTAGCTVSCHCGPGTLGVLFIAGE